MAKHTTSNIRYVNLTTGTTLNDYIAETCVRANKLKDRIQIAAVGCLMHLGKHGNKPHVCESATNLINGLGQGIQTKALIEWFIEFGLILDTDKGESFVDANIDKLKEKFETAKKTHWVSFAPQKAWAGFSFDDKLEALFKGAEDAQARALKSDEEAQVVDIDNNKLQLMQFLSNLSGEQLQNAMAVLRVGETTSTDEAEQFAAETVEYQAETEQPSDLEQSLEDSEAA